jgi:hypothetical protein
MTFCRCSPLRFLYYWIQDGSEDIFQHVVMVGFRTLPIRRWSVLSNTLYQLRNTSRIFFLQVWYSQKEKKIAAERSRKLGGQLISSKRQMRKKKPGITFLKKRSKTGDRRPYLLSWAEIVGAIRMFFRGVAIEFAYKLTFKPFQIVLLISTELWLSILKHRWRHI